MPDHSIGIIGGADGPTAVLVSGDLTYYAIVGIIAAALLTVGIVFLVRRRKRK